MIFLQYKLMRIKKTRLDQNKNMMIKIDNNYRRETIALKTSEAKKEREKTKIEMKKFATMRLDKSISMTYNALLKQEYIRQDIINDYQD